MAMRGRYHECMKMTRAQLIKEIDFCIAQGDSISSIAFRLMQFESELIAEGNESIELQQMERMRELTDDAFDDEIGALKGVERVYQAAEKKPE